MTLFLDSANLDDAREAASFGFIYGVTTNPTLLARAGHDDPRPVLEELSNLFEGPVFHQLIGHTAEELLEEAPEYLAIAPNIGIKIMCTLEGLRASSKLSDQTNILITSVFLPSQSLVAAETGANYVVPYVNRITRLKGSGPQVVAEMSAVLEGTNCEILAASIKTPSEAVETAIAGAQHLSMPLDVIKAMVESDLTQQALEAFDASQNE